MSQRRERDSVDLSRFGVLVAQLESIVASARQQTPDPILCFDLLSDLLSLIAEESKESIIQSQRKCEDALYSLLTLGARRPVRRLASVAMGKIILKGEGISVYSRASSLQGWLLEGKRSEPLSCAGAAQCLGELYRLFGRRITSGLTETVNVAAKLMKFHEDFVRQEALQMLQNALEGSDGVGAPAGYSEAFRIILRFGVGDKSYIVRIAAARCLKTFATIGGPGLGISEFENSATYCVKVLEDSVSSVRDAFAEALGAFLALGLNPEAQVQPKVKGNSTQAKKWEVGLQKHLILPFMKASGARMKELRVGLALSWVFLLQALRFKYLLPDSELPNFALRAMEMLEGSLVDAQALACVLYILRVGATDQMTEPTQRSFLVLLGRQLESPDISPAMRVASLRTLSYLLMTMGEVPTEFKEILDNTVVAALSHSEVLVRTEASLMLRSLVEVDPTSFGGLISYGVTTLHALGDSVTKEMDDNLKVILDSLSGQALALGALVSISPRLCLGYPAKLPRLVLEVSKKLLTRLSRNTYAATVEKEAGWLLLSSLVASMPKEEFEDQVFDILSLWAAPFGGNPERHNKKDEDLTSAIRVWSAAVEALIAFIKSFVTPAVAISSGILLQPVLVYLSGALSLISSLVMQQQKNLKLYLDVFIIRTLIAYQSLPDPMSYQSDHPHILKICSTPFRNPSGCEASSCLRLLLDKRDSCLGPWTPGRDWLEDELRAFEGGKDGLMPCVWEKNLPSFPQPETMSKMVVNQMLLCFGTIFATQDTHGKLILLGMIEQCLKSGKKQAWHAANITNICVGLLAGLKALLSLRSQALEVEILNSAQAVFQGILSEGEICASQRRASAEGLGLLARLGNDIFTARMTRSLLGGLVAASDSNYIGSIAFSLGCIHRSAGGIALSTMVPATVSSIFSLAKSSNAKLQVWSLHSLLLTIEAAGLSYVSHVQATLLLSMEVLLSEENGWVDLREGVGRLINAIVAVLGPELSPESTFFSRCKSVVAELSSGQETSALLECVRFSQQLVLFAPQAVSVHSHVQTLLPTLFSRQPTLRRLAVSTLKHLIEKDPVSVIDERIEVYLFCMLDEETDSEIVNLVRSTIRRLYYISCPSRSSRWIALFRNIVLATLTRKDAAEDRTEYDSTNDTHEKDDRAYYGEDDEDMIASSHNRQTQPTNSDISHSYPKREKHLRFRTRVFAAECLSCLPTAVGDDPAHFDPSLAKTKQQPNRQAKIGDWLVLHTQDLIALAYQISTSQFENMQSIGVGLLCTIMEKFGDLPDPELPGHLLMEQYQAQLVSAVRTALATLSSPLLLEAGLQLAIKILTSSITMGDRVALRSMFSLISRPLNEFNDIYYPSFADWVACKIKIRLLEAHASVKCYTYGFLREHQSGMADEYRHLLPMISESSSILGKYWIRVLSDYGHLCFGLQSKSNYIPFLDGIQSPLVSSKVQPCLDEAWPVILQAVALDAVPVKIIDDRSEPSADGVSANNIASGYSMVRLAPSEYHFVWGFALLALFQAHAADRQVLPISCGKSNIGRNSSIKSKNPQSSRFCEVALLVLQSLSVERFFSSEFLSLDLCRELLQILLYLDRAFISCHDVAVRALLQIVQMCPDEFFKREYFTCAAMEVCAKFFSEIVQNTNHIPKDQQSFKDLISALFTTAEIITVRSNPEERSKLTMALLSMFCECIKGASTIPWLSTIMSVARNIVPLLKTHVKDKASICEDSLAHMDTILGSWQNEIFHLSQICIKSVHSLETRDDSCKLLLMKLAFCLEEAMSLARLAKEAQQDDNKDKSMFLCTLYKNSTKCIQLALSDSSVQVQIIGLNVIKSTIMKELGQDSSRRSHFLILFILGEFLGDIFTLIETLLKGSVSKEMVTICDECLRVFVHLHTLLQGREAQKGVMHLLLEGIVMIVCTVTENHSRELNDLKSHAMRLVSHFAQTPTSAAQFRDILLAMPTARRQKLQDVIRASLAQGSNALQGNPTPLSIKLTVQTKQQPHMNFSSSAPQPDIDIVEEEDDDDDWDAFQSFPATDAAADSQADGTSTSTHNPSSLESGDFSKNVSQISSDHPHHNEMDIEDSPNLCQMENSEESSGAVHGDKLSMTESHGDGNETKEHSDLNAVKNADVSSFEELSSDTKERTGTDPNTQNNLQIETSSEQHLACGELKLNEVKHSQLVGMEGHENNHGNICNPQPLDKMRDEQDQVHVEEKATKIKDDENELQKQPIIEES